jgi:hypothetical protein
MQDDSRLLPTKLEQKIVDDLLENKITPEQATRMRNKMLHDMYGPEPPEPKKLGRPRRPHLPCPYCKNGVILNGTEGCGNCHGRGWVHGSFQ